MPQHCGRLAATDACMITGRPAAPMPAGRPGLNATRARTLCDGLSKARRCAAGGRHPVLLPAPQRNNQQAAVRAGASFVGRLLSRPLLLSMLELQQRLAGHFLLLQQASYSILPC